VHPRPWAKGGIGSSSPRGIPGLHLKSQADGPVPKVKSPVRAFLDGESPCGPRRKFPKLASANETYRSSNSCSAWTELAYKSWVSISTWRPSHTTSMSLLALNTCRLGQQTCQTERSEHHVPVARTGLVMRTRPSTSRPLSTRLKKKSHLFVWRSSEANGA
jgi:hypothetical protein